MVVTGSENCLFLNVYTPPNALNRSLPVLFWIHGGGFVSGSGNKELYGPEYLIDHDIIVVTINYRLGVFGFLNLDYEMAPGNMGLMDQVIIFNTISPHKVYIKH